MATSEMGAKIENAFHSIGREASRPNFPGLEFMARHFNMETHMACGNACHNLDEFLNDGWRMGERIMCPPFVIIIFNRPMETKE